MDQHAFDLVLKLNVLQLCSRESERILNPEHHSGAAIEILAQASLPLAATQRHIVCCLSGLADQTIEWRPHQVRAVFVWLDEALQEHSVLGVGPALKDINLKVQLSQVELRMHPHQEQQSKATEPLPADLPVLVSVGSDSGGGVAELLIIRRPDKSTTLISREFPSVCVSSQGHDGGRSLLLRTGNISKFEVDNPGAGPICVSLEMRQDMLLCGTVDSLVGVLDYAAGAGVADAVLPADAAIDKTRVKLDVVASGVVELALLSEGALRSCFRRRLLLSTVWGLGGSLGACCCARVINRLLMALGLTAGLSAGPSVQLAVGLGGLCWLMPPLAHMYTAIRLKIPSGLLLRNVWVGWDPVRRVAELAATDSSETSVGQIECSVHSGSAADVVQWLWAQPALTNSENTFQLPAELMQPATAQVPSEQPAKLKFVGFRVPRVAVQLWCSLKAGWWWAPHWLRLDGLERFASLELKSIDLANGHAETMPTFCRRLARDHAWQIIRTLISTRLARVALLIILALASCIYF